MDPGERESDGNAPAAASGGLPRTAVVTGGASGLGRQIAFELARAGCRVVIVGRDRERLDSARAALDRAVGRPAVETVVATDLALVEEARRVAGLLAAEHPKISILVNNAGGLFRRRDLTPEGHERTFALNVLCPFVLASLLAPNLARAAPARIVNIVSAAHRFQHLDLDDLELGRGYGAYRAYGRSKLALLLLTRAFARQYSPLGIGVFGVHPGLVRTRFGQNNPGPYGVAFRIALGLFGSGVARGAATAVYAALEPSLEAASGSYLAHRSVHHGSPGSNDLRLANALLARCGSMTGIGVPTERTAAAASPGSAPTGSGLRRPSS